MNTFLYVGITAATHGRVIPSPGMKFGLFAALSISHGCLNSLRTSHLAAITRAFVFINVAITAIITLVLFFLTPIHQMQPPELVFATVQNRESPALSLCFAGWADRASSTSCAFQKPTLQIPSLSYLACSVSTGR